MNLGIDMFIYLSILYRFVHGLLCQLRIARVLNWTAITQRYFVVEYVMQRNDMQILENLIVRKTALRKTEVLDEP